jgi:hypothetical protein
MSCEIILGKCHTCDDMAQCLKIVPRLKEEREWIKSKIIEYITTLDITPKPCYVDPNKVERKTGWDY